MAPGWQPGGFFLAAPCRASPSDQTQVKGGGKVAPQPPGAGAPAAVDLDLGQGPGEDGPFRVRELNPDQVPDAPTHDFNEFLHELRTRELRRLPPGAKTVLSGGCSGGWYFRCVKECYPELERHIGVEAYKYYSTPGNNYSHALLGIQTPILVGIGGLILGVILMFASWPFFRGYFSRRLEAADPAVLEEELAPYQRADCEAIAVSGPDISLEPRTAQTLALALHELSTNAAKYGALSVISGRLRLTWELQAERLVLHWVESNGPPTQPPASPGLIGDCVSTTSASKVRIFVSSWAITSGL